MGPLVAQCDGVALASRYRWRMLIVGVKQEYKLGEHDGAAGIDHGGVAGQTVQIIVQAVNGNLEGVASEPVTFTVPGAKASRYRNLATTEEAPAVSESPNRNGNGSSRPARVA